MVQCALFTDWVGLLLDPSCVSYTQTLYTHLFFRDTFEIQPVKVQTLQNTVLKMAVLRQYTVVPFCHWPPAALVW